MENYKLLIINNLMFRLFFKHFEIFKLAPFPYSLTFCLKSVIRSDDAVIRRITSCEDTECDRTDNKDHVPGPTTRPKFTSD